MTINVYLDSVAEWKLLAALTDKKHFDYILSLKPDLFTNDRRNVLSAIQQCYLTYQDITPEGIEAFLGKPSPTELDVSIANTIEPLVDRLHSVAIRRQLVEKSRELQSIAESQTLNLDTVHTALEFIPLLQEEDSSIVSGSNELLTRYKRKKDGSYQFISTGFPILDTYLGGEYAAELTLLGGEPGTGKTAFAFDSMLNMAFKDIPSGMINLEMTKDLIVMRGAANLADIDAEDIMVGALNDEEESRFELALNQINDLPIHVISIRGANVTAIIGHVRILARKGCKVIFIDHLQLIESENDNRNQALGEITLALKNAASKFHVKIVILTQLTDKGGGKFVVRDSGDVESKVDTFIVMIATGDAPIRRIIFRMEKNRNGKLGEFPMLFYSTRQRFVDAAQRPMAVAAD